MTLFRLKKKCGNHVEKDKKGKLITYTSKPGSNIVESDRDLVAISPSKFELVGEQISEDMPTAPNIPESSKKKGKAKITAPKIKTSEESEYGVDVTSEFPTASKVELKVFEKSKNWFTVVDPDDDTVLNDKSLRRGKVEDFLKDYLKDDDGEDNTDDDEDDDNDDDDNDEDGTDTNTGDDEDN